jgi:predicted metalloprotease
MDIEGRRQSSNVEDRRGMGPVRTGVGLSLGGVLFLVVLSLLGINPLPYLGVATKEQPEVQVQQPDQPYQESSQEAKLSSLAKVTLASTEDTWNKFFDGKYPPPTMVMFTEATPTKCGTGEAAMGPFYCPVDRKLYLDLSFFQEMEQKFHAPGDFARAYVIAHEVGHHVQNLLGTADKVRNLQEGNPRVANELSVRMELQADCYAGVWAHDAAPQLKINQQDVEEGMRAATAIGDDTLQRQMQGRVVPDSFTHGTSQQRVRWLMAGMQSGDPKACDTFSADPL